MKKLVAVWMLLIAGSTFGQQVTGDIVGTVISLKTGEKLFGARAVVDDNGRKYQISTKKIINYTCNDPEFKVNNTVNQKTPIPSELKNIEGVKLFQDWLDVNAQGWATGFTNGVLNKGAGYGNFGQ